MIPKAEIAAVAEQERLLATTVDKDYVLGWLLHGIAAHPRLSRWVFKGGTCLKKCFFETYRFSEDLDFTVPREESITHDSVTEDLRTLCASVAAASGIVFPADGLTVEVYTNKAGSESINARLTYIGPWQLQKQSRQRVQFDITQNEILVDAPDSRAVFHRYSDAPAVAAVMRCYSVNEILAEKTRALVERSGRARDVYDLVHIHRSFREIIDPAKARQILGEKFSFKQLGTPEVRAILAAVDLDTLRQNWEQQLAHQVPVLPPIETFMREFSDALTWWMTPAIAQPKLPAIAANANEESVPRELFPTRIPRAPIRMAFAHGIDTDAVLDRIRFGARNRLCVELRYDGVERIVEPYSLRRMRTGNLLLHVHELRRGGRPSDGHKSFKVNEIESVNVTTTPFIPRWEVEL